MQKARYGDVKRSTKRTGHHNGPGGGIKIPLKGRAKKSFRSFR